MRIIDNMEGFEGVEQKTHVLVSHGPDVDKLVDKANEILKEKSQGTVSFHNVPDKVQTYVIATVTYTP